MTALIILGIILAVILFLLSLRATVTVTYSEELSVTVKILFFRFHLFSKKKKKGPHSMSVRKARKIREQHRKKLAKKAQKAKQKQKEKEARKGRKKKRRFSDILSVLRIITSILRAVLKKFFKHVRVDLKRLKITVASSDASATAVAYGAVNAAVSAFLPVVESAKHFSLPKEGELLVEADFLAEAPSVDLHLSVSLRVWHVLDMALSALVAFIKRKLKEASEEEEEKSAEKESAPTSH